MQTLEVISINVWQILISLINLLILYIILKKFLYKPVKEVLAERQSELDEQFLSAKSAEDHAIADKEEWEKKIQAAQSEAESITQTASVNASRRSDQIIAEARERADNIVKEAQNDAKLQLKKAADEIKREMVDISAALAEKMLGRKISPEDHRMLIDSFIEKIGDNDGTNK